MAPGATGELVCIYRNGIYIQIRLQPAFRGGEGSPFFPQPQTDSALTGLDACIKTSADTHLFHKSTDKERGLLPAAFLPLFSNHANNLSSGTNCCVRGHRDVGGKETWVGWGCRRGGNVRGMEMQVGWGWRWGCGWDGEAGGMWVQAAAAPGPRQLHICASQLRRAGLVLCKLGVFAFGSGAGSSLVLLVPEMGRRERGSSSSPG